MQLSKEELLKIAHMARITIHENEIPDMLAQLQDVLNYAAQIIEVAQDADAACTKNMNVFREDQIVTCESKFLLQQAPESEGNFFVVPKILETE